MQQISIQIPDTQVSFMLELLKKFDFVKIEYTTMLENVSLSTEQRNLIEEERLKAKNNPDSLPDWEKVKGTLIVD